jgi:hypothetical protein
MRISPEVEQIQVPNVNFEVLSKSSLKIKKVTCFKELLKDGLKLKGLKPAIAIGDKVYVKI